ncbi:MFS general substrate transporter [Desarmillaria tabescens]|uniref:MFS general substrate transporter n=1 Tax=Armillaria tabescens TaxID=1929756 RepID=A0AA39N2S0_ARMTA|nr:MFS general substrate transporter [Desarmillaria tabescens]KAK0455358.1 MFS general substrate transporter [Desarmillaria tabescens]
MVSESTPLLDEVSRHEEIYNRFSPARKRTIVALVSWSALVPMYASGTFIPAIPQIAHDLNSMGSTISLAVSLSMFAASLGGMTCATYSGFYGRRLIYLASIPFLTLGSIGVALSHNVPEMMVWRFLQAFGTSGGMSVGAAVIGDIYKVTERGSAMGIFFGATLLGPALAPLAGGWGAHYASWRWTQATLALAGFLTFVLMLFFLPETSHPGTRGIDKTHENVESAPKRWTWVWLNPLAPLALLRSPLLMLMTFVGAAISIAYYALFVPIAYTIGAKYNITNEFIIGACILPGGIGNIIGAPLAGRLSDRVVIASRKKYGINSWRPEERLKAALVGALILVPLPVLLSGLITQYVDGELGLVLNLTCFFINGVGVNTVLTPLAAYMVDIMHSRSAEVMAASTCSRAMILSVAVAFVLPLIKLYGVAIIDGIISLIGWLAFVLLWVAIRYGKEMRGWVDIGFSTAEDT